MLTRRTATVTSSAPEAWCACAISALLGYLPVPTIRREVNERSAMTRGSMVSGWQGPGFSGSQGPKTLAPAHEIDDLDLVALADQLGGVVGATHDHEVALDGDTTRIDA